MANIKSAKKRIVQNLRRNEINRLRRTKIKTNIRKVGEFIETKNKNDANKHFIQVESDLAKSVSRGVFKRNTASRLISRLSKKIKSI